MAYTATDFDSSLQPYSQAYEGEIVFEDPIPVSELGEHFYIGVRLVTATDIFRAGITL